MKEVIFTESTKFDYADANFSFKSETTKTVWTRISSKNRAVKASTFLYIWLIKVSQWILFTYPI